MLVDLREPREISGHTDDTGIHDTSKKHPHDELERPDQTL